MDIQIFRHPATNFEIIKYYWPESLSGQANSAAGPSNQMSGIHYKFEREDGRKTCSCGLVYWGSDLPLSSNPWGLSIDDFGHRNHQTGELEVYYKSGVRKAESPTEYIFECDWCGTTSMQDGFFDESHNHKCELENLPESRFIWTVARLEIQNKKFRIRIFDENPENLDFGFLDLKLALEGATASSSSPDFQTALKKMLADGQLLLSEEVREGSGELSDWPSEYVNPTDEELGLHWEAERQNKKRYFLDNGEDSGYFKFSNAAIESDGLVRYTMTREAFTINAARSNMPLMRMPVIGLE